MSTQEALCVLDSTEIMLTALLETVSSIYLHTNSQVIFALCAFMIIHLNCKLSRLRFRFHQYFFCIRGDSLADVVLLQQWICNVYGIVAVFILHNLSSGELHVRVLHPR